MSNPQLKSRQERLRQKSAQAAVLNQFGLGSAKSRKGLGDKLLRDSDEDGEDNNEQNGDHSNGHLDSSADEGVGPVNEDQMVAEDEDQIAVQSTPGNSLFSAPPGTDDYFTGGESDSKRDRDKQNSAEGDQEGKPDNGQDIKKGQDGNDKANEDAEEGVKKDMSQKGEQEHTGHYTCWNCNESLSGQRYIIRDDNSYCIKCYEELFANTCEACNQKIGTDSKDLSYKDKHWHERCFKCSNCDVSLVDRLFGSRNDQLFCDNCYDEKFGAKCDACGQVFKAGMKKLEWNGQQWHEECFKCTNCSTEIGCNSFMPKDNQQYCIQCFNDLFAPKCKACGQPIMTGGVLYRNEPYHRDCFGCTNCKNNLVGQKFTSRDNQPYCADCFGELFAKRCTTCGKPITGIGGTKFISFDGRHWHNECFNCNGPNCGENLVGKGFITDQQEILCPNCAKLPYTKREELRQQTIQS